VSEETGSGGASGAGGPNSPKSLRRLALDLLVYAPAGVVLTALEDFPSFADKGRQQIDQQLRNAKVVGQFVVTKGQRDIEERLARRKAPSSAPPSGAPATTGPTAAPPVADDGPATPRPHYNGGAPSSWGSEEDADQPGVPFARSDAPAEVDTAIPGYDTLSASQVVRRLDGLSEDELGAIYGYEAATRSRRTILHRVHQLLGFEGVPGSPDTPD
jgi:hypothetical protein